MTVEQWATPIDPPAKHPAGTFGKRAELAEWRVEYRSARGPVTTRLRPAEPDERGKYALVSVTTTEDTIGVRAAHPDGRRIAAWWIGRAFGEGWAASPRTNARALGIRALTTYLTEIEEDEMDEPEEHMYEQERRSAVEEEASVALDQAIADGVIDEDVTEPSAAFMHAYLIGHAAAVAQAGDAYGEGYAAGLVAVAGRAQVWVKTRRRLDALRPGDVILGKGDRWWIVTDSAESAHECRVFASSGDERREVRAHPSRRVDVVEEISLADALAALKDGELGGTPVEDAVAVA